MAWNKDNVTSALLGGAGVVGGGALVAAGLTPATAWMIPIGAGVAATGAGTLISSGLDAFGSDQQEVVVPNDVQAVVDRGNQRGVVSRLLAPRIAAVQAVGDSYTGNPYARPTVVGRLTGDARNVEGGLGQIEALSADAYLEWIRKREQAKRSLLAALMGMDEQQQRLGGNANDVYWQARKLEEDIYRGNVENEISRSELRGDRIRAGAGIGAKLGGLAGSSIKTPTGMTNTAGNWSKIPSTTPVGATSPPVSTPYVVPALEQYPRGYTIAPWRRTIL